MASTRSSIVTDLDAVISHLIIQENEFKDSMAVDIGAITNLCSKLRILQSELILMSVDQQRNYSDIVGIIKTVYALIPNLIPHTFYVQPNEVDQKRILYLVNSQSQALKNINNRLHSKSENIGRLIQEIFFDLTKICFLSLIGSFIGAAVIWGPVPAFFMIGSLLHMLAPAPLGVIAAAKTGSLIAGASIATERFFSRHWYGFFPLDQSKKQAIQDVNEALVELANSRFSMLSTQLR